MSIFDLYDQTGSENTDQHSASSLSLDRDTEVDYHYADPQQIEQDLIKEPGHSVNLIHVFITIISVTILLFRLVQVQIVRGNENASLAKEHSIRQLIQTAQRGAIFDQRGEWLARNTSGFRIQITPSDLPRKKQDREAVYDKLGAALKWNDEEKEQFMNQIETKIGKQLDPIILKDNLEHNEALLLTERLFELPAVSVVTQEIRQYNHAADGISHLLGYVGRVSEKDLEHGSFRRTDVVGKNSIEAVYDTELRGKDGIIQAVVDSKGKISRTLSDRTKESISGHNLVLHVDSKLQVIMAEELRKGLTEAGLSSGVAIAMDPHSGAIKGMVSLPAYDNNLFAHGIPSAVYKQLTEDPNKPLINRATQGTFPPGSTIKPFMAAIGLQRGVITDRTRLDTPPEIQIGQWVFPNWQKIFIPAVDVKQAIAKSNDIFFYAVGGGWDKIKGLGVEQIGSGLELFGFGQKTGIDLPDERKGLIPDESWKQDVKNEPWYIGDTYHMAIGQGDLLITPLQLITATSAIANGGTLYRPQLVDRIVDQNGDTVSVKEKTEVRKDFIDTKHMQTVREGMRQTVTEGSGRQLADLPVAAAGKTGTAQIGANNEYLHSWFEVFAPYDDPQITLLVLGEKGSQENEGHTTAVPIAKSILQRYFSDEFKK